MSTPLPDPAKAHVVWERKLESPLTCCRFDPTGEFVFAAAEDHSVARWKLDADKPVIFKGHESWVNALAFSPDGATLISVGCEGRLVWWPARDPQPQPIRQVAAHAGWVRAVAVSPRGDLVASGGNDGLVKLWKMSDGSLVRELRGHESHVYSLTFDPSGDQLVSGDLKGVVKQWQVTDGASPRTFDAKALHSYNGGQGVDFGGVRSLTFAQAGKVLACGGLHKAENPLGAVHEPLVLTFAWDSQKLLRSHVADGLKGVAWRLVDHPAGFLMGVSGGSSGGFLLFWKPDQDKEFHRFQLPNLARDADLHRDGIRVATAHYDRTLRITRLAEKATA